MWLILNKCSWKDFTKGKVTTHRDIFRGLGGDRTQIEDRRQGEDMDSQRTGLEVYSLDAVASSPEKYCLPFRSPEAESSPWHLWLWAIAKLLNICELKFFISITEMKMSPSKELWRLNKVVHASTILLILLRWRMLIKLWPRCLLTAESIKNRLEMVKMKHTF